MLGTEVRNYNRSRALPVYLTRDGVWPIWLRKAETKTNFPLRLP